ncbi:ParB/RepB/Spo0J family partition protein [Clostridia bacterium OttesenSCG-928-F22]|nr:ParB/RepB/Spo0J family partition protein [Clostridia bacterium OttesenSCG-928-F22]
MKSRGLGKGLGALLGEATQEANTQEMELSLIDPNRAQARKTFEEESIRELAASIQEHGVIQPLIVTPRDGRYQIVAGERRYRAARMVGLSSVPVVIKELGEREAMEVSLIENLQREDLNAAEEAQGIQQLMEEFQLTQEDTAKRIGKSRPYIANSIRLLSLSSEVLEKVRTGEISAGHARCLVPLPKERQLELMQLVIEKELSVRQLEDLLKPAEKKRSKKEMEPELSVVEDMLRELLGTKVKISGSPRRGKIMIEYFSMQELEDIIEQIK